MQAAVLEKVGQLRVKEVAIPKCPADGMLIKVEGLIEDIRIIGNCLLPFIQKFIFVA